MIPAVDVDTETKESKLRTLTRQLTVSLYEELKLNKVQVYNGDIIITIVEYFQIITALDVYIKINNSWMSDSMINSIITVFDVTESSNIMYKPIVRCDFVPGECETIGWEFKICRNMY